MEEIIEPSGIKKIAYVGQTMTTLPTRLTNIEQAIFQSTLKNTQGNAAEEISQSMDVVNGLGEEESKLIQETKNKQDAVLNQKIA